MFRPLALVPGPDTGAACAARLTGQSLSDAEDTLEELVETGLPGTDRDRYRFHDLLRLYARTRLVDPGKALLAAGDRAVRPSRTVSPSVPAPIPSTSPRPGSSSTPSTPPGSGSGRPRILPENHEAHPSKAPAGWAS
ncbi:hypothetical protein [Streptomyces sp. NPDC002559]